MKLGILALFFSLLLAPSLSASDMSLASIEFPVGITLFFFGFFFGALNWMHSIAEHTSAPTGTIMLSVLPILFGLQLILAFFSQDMSSIPKTPIHVFMNKPNYYHLEKHADKR